MVLLLMIPILKKVVPSSNACRIDSKLKCCTTDGLSAVEEGRSLGSFVPCGTFNSATFRAGELRNWNSHLFAAAICSVLEDWPVIGPLYKEGQELAPFPPWDLADSSAHTHTGAGPGTWNPRLLSRYRLRHLPPFLQPYAVN